MSDARFVLPFAVRSYEIDARGEAPPEAYLRWFQELAIRASAARGFDTARYHALGSTWWVREFALEIHGPLQSGDMVAGTTWVGGFQRVMSWRQYRLARPDGTILANGAALWAYIDAKTGRPRRLDQELVDGFLLDDEFAVADRDWGFGLLGGDVAPDDAAFRRCHTVLWSELDGSRHVNNAEYARWIGDSVAAADGPGARVRRLRISYERGVTEGATVEWRLARAGDGLRRFQVICNDGTVAIRAIAEIG